MGKLTNLSIGEPETIDWLISRYAAKAAHKVTCEILRQARAELGKETGAQHYMTEAKLINFALTGTFAPVNRDALPQAELDLLLALESRDGVLIGRGVDYKTRKEILSAMASEARLRLNG